MRSTRNLVAESNAIGPVLATAGYLLLGTSFGLLSVFLLPHSLIHRSRFHGLSLVVSPVLTGLVMSQVGRLLRRQGKDSVQIESFGYGFTFAFGSGYHPILLRKLANCPYRLGWVYGQPSTAGNGILGNFTANLP